MNADDLTNKYSEPFVKITVSQNQLVTSMPNSYVVVIGAIAGILALIALIVFLIKRKTDKKDKAEAKS